MSPSKFLRYNGHLGVQRENKRTCAVNIFRHESQKFPMASWPHKHNNLEVLVLSHVKAKMIEALNYNTTQ